jgi:uncharacterized membrane protein (DUF485 family)
MSVTQSCRGSASGYEIVHRSREFRTLRRRFAWFVVPVTVLFIGWYFLHVLVAVFAPGFMRTPLIGDVNIGLCFGVLEFVSTFAITMGYHRWARRRFDPLAGRLRQRLDSGRPRFTARGALWSIYGGLIISVGLIIFSPVVSGQVDPATGASRSLIADTHINVAFFPLDNPGIVSIPLAFFPRLAGFGHDR